MRALTTVLTMTALLFTAKLSPAQTDTTFTYQGELRESSNAANGMYNMDFSMFNALAGGSQIGSTVSIAGQDVVDGLFSVELDFGAQDFAGSQYWLEIVIDGNTLSPRQPMTASPFSIQTRGIFVDEDNNVGIGTSTPVYPIHVESDGTRSIYAKDYATTGPAFGGYFESASSSGRGVFGLASASAGITDGVFGQSNSTAGRGICGWAPASSGTTYGVFGTSDSTSGTGVAGEARATSGNTTGVYGKSSSSSGRGVYGLATGFLGGDTTYGVYGESSSAFGRGVYGIATSTSGTNYGGRFQSDSSSGEGVFAEATASNGPTRGVHGLSRSTTGYGVLGVANATSGNNIGVYGLSHSTSGQGIFGWAFANSGTTYGGYFENESTSGHGVFGTADAFTGITYGGRFESWSATGRGVFGLANLNSGVNYGVVGHSNSSDGYDFWASGAGTNYGSNSSRRWKNNIEPISDPLRKLAQLRGVYYDWDEEHGGHHDVGMIAEEVGKVLPEIVGYEENGVDAIGMDYSKLTPLLVEAVNALNERHEAEIVRKDAQINELAERIARLESLIERRDARSGD